MYLNKAILIGNLTRDPEIKALPSGSKVCTFSIATNRIYKDKEGVRQEMVEYHNIVVFGKVAELSAQYLKKGQQVLIEGRIQTRSWDAQNGEKKYRTEIVADSVQFGNRPVGGSSSSTSTAGAPKTDKSSGSKTDGSSKPDTNSGEAIEYPSEEINADDIPF
jgi:single-strand DNA-binding protein